MKTISTLLIMLLAGFFTPGTQAQSFETDEFETSGGPLSITFIGHASLMFQWKDMVIHIDPVSREANYSKLPDADLVLITHEHGDHLDPAALGEIVTDKTMIILTQRCYEKYPHGMVLANGDETEFKGIHIKAVPAYNLVHHRRWLLMLRRVFTRQFSTPTITGIRTQKKSFPSWQMKKALRSESGK